MRAPLTVTYADGRTVDVVAGPREAVELERRYGVGFSTVFGTETSAPREEWWYFLAWHALHRKGEDTRDFEAFINAIESVRFAVESETEKPAVPFDPAPMDISSPPSPPQE